MPTVTERFLSYVEVDTRSIKPKPGETPDHPTSKGQTKFAEVLRKELQELGYDPMVFADSSFLVHLPATSEEYANAPHVAFAAHLDTYHGFPGAAKPKRMVYQAGDIVLDEENGVVIEAKDLEGLDGKEIIVTDGTTVLGADDKAGVAVMMSQLHDLSAEKTEHGPLTFWFCVDEEVGLLNPKVLPKDLVESWDILWTLDGERFGSIDIGCLLCPKVDVIFHGQDAHPGVYPDKVKPAQYSAVMLASWITMMPTPMETSGLESFYYVGEIEGNATKATVSCAPRTFDKDEADKMMALLEEMAGLAARKYGTTVEVDAVHQCFNTRVPIEANMELVQPAIDAFGKFDIVPEMMDVRGGTDGAMINMHYPDLPAPNIGAGCANLHSPTEFLVVEELVALDKLVALMIVGYMELKK